jgi:hypothetical protein
MYNCAPFVHVLLWPPPLSFNNLNEITIFLHVGLINPYPKWQHAERQFTQLV